MADAASIKKLFVQNCNSNHILEGRVVVVYGNRLTGWKILAMLVSRNQLRCVQESCILIIVLHKHFFRFGLGLDYVPLQIWNPAHPSIQNVQSLIVQLSNLQYCQGFVSLNRAGSLSLDYFNFFYIKLITFFFL